MRAVSPLILAVLLTCLLAAVIAVLTLTPPQSGALTRQLGDKAAHFLAFAALSFPLAAVRPRWCGAILMGAAVYGGAIELIQPHVGRGLELADWLADMAGAASGCALGVALALWHRRARS